MIEPKYKDGQQAFRDAIAAGRLSNDPASPYYAGRYMYMGTYDSGDQFKNINTREYLPAGTSTR